MLGKGWVESWRIMITYPGSKGVQGFLRGKNHNGGE